jgi:hypothetical protein
MTPTFRSATPASSNRPSASATASFRTGIAASLAAPSTATRAPDRLPRRTVHHDAAEPTAGGELEVGGHLSAGRRHLDPRRRRRGVARRDDRQRRDPERQIVDRVAAVGRDDGDGAELGALDDDRVRRDRSTGVTVRHPADGARSGGELEAHAVGARLHLPRGRRAPAARRGHEPRPGREVTQREPPVVVASGDHRRRAGAAHRHGRHRRVRRRAPAAQDHRPADRERRGGRPGEA